MSATIKVLGRDVGPGDWIGVNDCGTMRMGKVDNIRPAKGFWLHVEMHDGEGGRHFVQINLHEKYQLFTWTEGPHAERYDEELIHMIRGVGRLMSQRYARMPLEKIKCRASDYKFTARDGRLVFKDGSSLRLNDDGTRAVFNAKGDTMEWPRLKSAS